MSNVREDIDDVLKLIRPAPLSEEELVLREFSDIKEIVNEIKEFLKE
jgi:hypothetical protein